MSWRTDCSIRLHNDSYVLLSAGNGCYRRDYASGKTELLIGNRVIYSSLSHVSGKEEWDAFNGRRAF